MSKSYTPIFQRQASIYISKIVFEKDVETSDVTLLGYYDNDFSDEPMERDYLCDFSMLTDLLLLAGQAGDDTISVVSERLGDNDLTYPTIIDVDLILGKPLEISQIDLTIYKPLEEHTDGIWREIEDDIFIIEAVNRCEHQTGVEQDQKPSSYDMLAEQLIRLDRAFQFYQKLVAKGLKKKKARRKTGLKDKQLFKIAFLNHLIIQNG